MGEDEERRAKACYQVKSLRGFSEHRLMFRALAMAATEDHGFSHCKEGDRA